MMDFDVTCPVTSEVVGPLFKQIERIILALKLASRPGNSLLHKTEGTQSTQAPYIKCFHKGTTHTTQFKLTKEPFGFAVWSP